MVFDINKFKDRNVAMCCATLEESRIFSEYLDSIGRYWNSGNSYTELSYAEEGVYTFYNFNTGSYCKGSTRSLIDKGKKVLYFSDFVWQKSYLKEFENNPLFDDYIKAFKITSQHE